ncbi:MAG: exodeoxyribonuclease V subunit gamma, partial [Spirochaetes bacterium]|nr:exodeoxyribonuclease V subunit gamma [Spirochaetota bacterium]
TKTFFEEKLTSQSVSRGFFQGGVTFCSMVPMRSIPFKIIYLLGMNYDQFPRKDYEPSFHLLLKYPKQGDYFTRDEDRYLFLETLLSCRKKLIISYLGQNLKDQRDYPPSILVTQLLDEIYHTKKQYNPKLQFKEFISQMVNKHHRHAYHPDYFQKNSLSTSYSHKYYEAAKVYCAKEKRKTSFFVTNKIDKPSEEIIIPFDDFILFFKHPQKYFVNKQLGLQFEEFNYQYEEWDPVELYPLDKYKLSTQILNYSLDNNNNDQILKKVIDLGLLPAGSYGNTLFYEQFRLCQTLINEVKKYQKTYKLVNNHSFKLPLKSNLTLAGRLTDLYEPGILEYTFSRISGKFLLSFWLKHLVLCTLKQDDQILSTKIFRSDNNTSEIIQFKYIPHAEQLLEKYSEKYITGQKEPLLFFPGVSYQYAGEFLKKQKVPLSSQQVLNKINKSWSGQYQDNRERDDLYVQKIFNYTLQLNELSENFPFSLEEENDFTKNALTIYQPMIESLNETI